MQANKVGIENIGTAVAGVLDTYLTETVEAVNRLSEASAKELVELTKASAPKGATGRYKKNIACKLKEKGPRGDTWVWYVKAPDHRLTHLLVNGHAKKNGGRTKANPFLANAVQTVSAKFENALKELVKK